MKRSYLPFIALGLALIAVAVAAMIYLVASAPDGGPESVPTEVQIFGTTATSVAPREVSATTLGLRATTTSGGAAATTTSGGAAATTTSGGAAATTTTTTTKVAPSTTQRPAKDANGLTIVRASQLPKEAQQTLALIAKGGPYPFDRDGVVFENREGILAKKTSGYYREYTVVTPGERDRGARRIVTGAADERFYTADHYETFVRVEEGR